MFNMGEMQAKRTKAQSHTLLRRQGHLVRPLFPFPSTLLSVFEETEVEARDRVQEGGFIVATRGQLIKA